MKKTPVIYAVLIQGEDKGSGMLETLNFDAVISMYEINAPFSRLSPMLVRYSNTAKKQVGLPTENPSGIPKETTYKTILKKIRGGMNLTLNLLARFVAYPSKKFFSPLPTVIKLTVTETIMKTSTTQAIQA